MKKVYISNLSEGDKVEDFFMIKNTDTKTDKNGNYYLDMVVGDNTGEMICRKFRASPEEIEMISVGDIFRIKGIVKEYNSNKNLNAIAMEAAMDNDKINMYDYVSAAPVKPEEMLEIIKGYIKKISNKEIKNLVIEIYKIHKEKLMYYPAAKSNHHSIKSGLLYHMLRMLQSAEALGAVYQNVNMDLMYAGIMLHDICKIEEMESNNLGIVSDYTMEGKLLGHIIMGIKLIEKTAVEMGIDPEISIMLEHMILSHHYYADFGSPKKPMFLEAELLHYIDMIDARVYDFENASENIKPGEFSDKIWVLDNRNVYNSTFDKNTRTMSRETENKQEQLKLE
ncbi:MAG: 3'-5' exoribonuclease YhaM [Clostridiales bacterium 38_11]|nr:MAG: 3'-5' exoribonuclease YhaM [Clostridiales bacterium 38_11]HBH13381.1 CMP-binding protein [Clostridiales bacterium]